MKQSPLNVVKQGFGSKAKLVDAVRALATADLWIDRVSSVKGLGKVPNSKLLRLHGLLTDAKARFGSRAKLIGAILEIEKRGKDGGYKQRLESLPLPRLLDLHGAASRRASRASRTKQPGAAPAAKKAKAGGESSASPAAAKKAASTKTAAAKAAPEKKTSTRPAASKAPAQKSAKKSKG